MRRLGAISEVVLCAAALTAPVSAGETSPSRKADLARLPANTWVAVTPRYVGAPDGGRLFPMHWNNKGTYDPATKRVIVMDRWADKARSHTIYANAVLAYDPASNTCTVLKLCNWKRQSTPKGGYRTVALPANEKDPTPIPRHPLGCLALVPELKTFYLVNGLNQTSPRGHPADTWKLDLAKGNWTLATARYKGQAHPPNPSMGHVMEYDPDAKAIVYFGSRHAGGHEMWTFDPAKGKWKAGAKDPKAGRIPTGSAGITYDSKRKLIVLLRGQDLRTYSTGRKEWKSLKPCPRKTGAPGFSYDSKHDVFLATTSERRAKTATTLIYDPAKNEWGEIAGPRLPAGSRWSSVTYAPDHNVFVFQGGTWEKPHWLLFRYDPKTAKFKE